jgi:hypothetical protein
MIPYKNWSKNCLNWDCVVAETARVVVSLLWHIVVWSCWTPSSLAPVSSCRRSAPQRRYCLLGLLLSLQQLAGSLEIPQPSSASSLTFSLVASAALPRVQHRPGALVLGFRPLHQTCISKVPFSFISPHCGQGSSKVSSTVWRSFCAHLRSVKLFNLEFLTLLFCADQNRTPSSWFGAMNYLCADPLTRAISSRVHTCTIGLWDHWSSLVNVFLGSLVQFSNFK